MFKRIISILLSVLLPAVCTPTTFASTANYVLNEVFDDYATNSTPETFTLKGINARIVSRNESDKAAYTQLWGSGSGASFPLKVLKGSVVFSFDMKVSGKLSGSVLSLSSSTSLFNMQTNGSILLEDDYRVGGYSGDIWRNYAAVINFDTQKYSVYIDGNCEVDSRSFYKEATMPAEFKFSFTPANSAKTTEVYLDNVRVYSSDVLLTDSSFPTKKINTTTENFTLQSVQATDDSVYVNSYGTRGLAGIVDFVQKTDTKSEFANYKDTTLSCLHLAQSGTKDPYVQITTSVIGTSSLVIAFDLSFTALQTGQMVVRTVNESATDSFNLVSTDANHKLLVGSTPVADAPMDKWITLAIVCDFINGVCDAYIDNQLVGSDIEFDSSVIPYNLRFGFKTNKTTVTPDNEFYVNRIKVYDGTEPRELDESHLLTDGTELISLNDTREKAIDALGDDCVYMAHGDFYFMNGAKHRYSESKFGKTYLTSDGIVMTDSALIAESLGTAITLSDDTVTSNGKTVTVGETAVSDGSTLDTAPVIKDGTLYLPAASFAKSVLGKYAYEDIRGFVLVSDIERNYSNSETVTDNLEDIDILYRYLQYDRPTGDQLYDAVVQNSYKQHPRMFIKKDDIAALRQKVDSNSDLKNALSALLERCESYMVIAPTKYTITNGLRLFKSCETVRDRIIDLATAYYITGATKYLDRLWLEAKNALNWQDWNVTKHYLDSGEIGPGMAIAYDTLYDYLTDEQKQWFRTRVEELFLDYAIGTYTGTSIHSSVGHKATYSNWGVVTGTSMLMMALTFIDEEDADSLFTQKCKFLASNALQTLEYPIGHIFPDGAGHEGMGYWSYYVIHLGWAIRTLQNMCGTDYGLIDSPGLDRMNEFGLYIQTANGAYNHTETSDAHSIEFRSELYLLASLTGQSNIMGVLNRYHDVLNADKDARYLLWYEPTQSNTTISSYPLDKNFDGRVVTLRSSWDDAEQTYVGIRGGKNYQSSTHYDKGSFIFETLGERWFVDLGSDNYNMALGYTGQNGWTVYRKRTEGHNNLVINPTVELPGQTIDAVAAIKKFESKPRGAIVVYDLKDVYEGEVEYYDRAFLLGEDRRTLIVQDELELTKADSDIYLFLHTKGNITINSDGRSAIVEQNGKKVKVEVICDAYEWTLAATDTTPIFPEISRDDENPRDEYSKITLKGKASGKLNISVKITPYEDGNTYEKHSFIPYTEWTLPDGQIDKRPSLDAIYVNGEAIKDFDPTVTSYVVDAYKGDVTSVCYAKEGDYSLDIEQAKSLKDIAKITVKNENGTRIYSIAFRETIRIVDKLTTKKPTIGIPAGVTTITPKEFYASHEPQSENPVTNAADGNLETRWAADTDGAYMEFDLGEVKDISGIAIGYMLGSTRKYYNDILISEDGLKYTRICKGGSLSGTNEYEYIEYPAKARYIRYIGYGNTDNAWNSITEFHACTVAE